MQNQNTQEDTNTQYSKFSASDDAISSFKETKTNLG